MIHIFLSRYRAKRKRVQILVRSEKRDDTWRNIWPASFSGSTGHGQKKLPPPPSRFDGGIVEETGLNFFSGLELDFNQRTIFKLACASSNSRKTLRENNRSIFIYKKAINRKVKVKLNSPPSSLSSSFPIHSPHVFNYCKFIVRFILDAPIFPPPSSMQLHKMCNLRNCIAQQQRLTRVNP